MLKRITSRLHLRLRKGEKGHIMWQLIIDYILLFRLRIYKLIKGIKHPIVHYYALCWNEEKMLPFMFDYYDKFVDEFVIYDNYSTDSSEEIIKAHRNARIVKFKTEGNDNVAKMNIKNQCWKQSRGKADFVVVCDMDEFIYHPQLAHFLSEASRHKYSMFYPQGYEMCSEKYPQYDGEHLLTELVPCGVADKWYCKSILFDPNRIVEMNYVAGAHTCDPLGVVNVGEDKELKMLHYKWMGLDEFLERKHLFAQRRSESDIQRNLGRHYMRADEEVIQSFNTKLKEAKKVVS